MVLTPVFQRPPDLQSSSLQLLFTRPLTARSTNSHHEKNTPSFGLAVIAAKAA
ncbi:hypothetical protein CABS01_07253 [Colletotrichum abscissum]|uniref:Uncharacterized protein n=1 Tax=Colletotrichum costaricense TaxID=1209916 RepID=A0AAI9YM43_9PEZI|nr:uncharacterized protein CCOS01_13067 [Colletotrichum costaricense]XP_060403501.1 uncharacterized protein CABS01_07253 [Colletotrichum abscissum]KAK1513847.1 hypothetical protein CABS01_07253 [Colletotrichum abscissum]KAK1515869.1 hypothetical protein CCOS01_13067 [Colletotrichum costaricense]